MFQSALPALGLLLLMVGLAFALQRWKGRLPGLLPAGGPALRVLQSVPLGPQQRLVSVQVGEGANAVCLVLGVAPGSVQTLHSLPLPAGSDPASTAARGRPLPSGSFASRLTQLMQAPDRGSHAPS
jgi:flagellar protein FliO/FliZ